MKNDKRDKRAIYMKSWRLKNKKNIALSRKIRYDKVKDSSEFKEKKKIADKKYRDENKEKIEKVAEKYREENREKIRIADKEYYKKRKDKVEFKQKRNEYHKKYYISNKEKIKEYSFNNKENRNIRERERYKNDPVYRLSRLITSGFKKSFKGKYKKTKTIEILGCSFEEFKIYLESKFETWMNWENYGKYNGELNYGWDIDHIIPILNAKNEEELIKLNHYTNLQPLCSKINRDIKKDNYEF